VVGRLRAYDEYLKDVRDVRDELATQEQEALEKLESKSEEMKKTPSVEEKMQLDTDTCRRYKNAKRESKCTKKDNTLLYVGLGVGALLLILIFRKNKLWQSPILKIMSCVLCPTCKEKMASFTMMAIILF
jgi:hypothetical protein